MVCSALSPKKRQGHSDPSSLSLCNVGMNSDKAGHEMTVAVYVLKASYVCRLQTPSLAAQI
jgi:hypothetical protein